MERKEGEFQLQLSYQRQQSLSSNGNFGSDDTWVLIITANQQGTSCKIFQGIIHLSSLIFV